MKKIDYQNEIMDKKNPIMTIKNGLLKAKEMHVEHTLWG